MTIKIEFNKDFMIAKDLKACTETLEDILRSFDRHTTKVGEEGRDWTPEQAEEIAASILQIRSNFSIR